MMSEVEMGELGLVLLTTMLQPAVNQQDIERKRQPGRKKRRGQRRQLWESAKECKLQSEPQSGKAGMSPAALEE
eukprot:6204913-Pleurochrysis_carterae.AAC.1